MEMGEIRRPQKGHVYKPIPRDRDQVFHRFEGVLPNIANSSWGARNLRNFDYEVDDIIGQNFNARYLDRSFMNQMDRSDFIEAGTHIQQNLTDEVIHEAIALFPDTVYALTGEEIEAKLRSRRDKIVEQGQEYYEILAKEVDIVGSNLDELFKVERLDDERTTVTVLPLHGLSNDTLYHREFYRSETNEIRLYGIAGKDRFETTGSVRKGIIVRLVAGTGESEMSVLDEVKGPAQNDQGLQCG